MKSERPALHRQHHRVESGVNEIVKPSISEQWLSERAPGFKDLPLSDRAAILDFSFLWSLFEAKVMNTSARVGLILEKVDEWAANNTLEANLYEVELDYFRNRYFADGQLTYHFPHLLLRGSDHPDLVQRVIEGVSNEPRDQMLALLIIVWRLRNNLFHGAKWAYELRDQCENFAHANQVLIRLLERHGQLG